MNEVIQMLEAAKTKLKLEMVAMRTVPEFACMKRAVEERKEKVKAIDAQIERLKKISAQTEVSA